MELKGEAVLESQVRHKTLFMTEADEQSAHAVLVPGYPYPELQSAQVPSLLYV